MVSLSSFQFNVVHNMMSFTIAAMFAAFVFFILSRELVDRRYRGALIMSALVVGIAGYHYLRIYESWTGAFVLSGGVYEATGTPFNDAYRYVDWLLTVPLLVAELVAVLNLPRGATRSLTIRLGIAAAVMIALGYPGEIATTIGARIIWGIAGTVPFIYILFVLFGEMGEAINRQPEQARGLVKIARSMLLITWLFYPIVYFLPVIPGFESTSALVSVQVGYTIADVVAKAGFGLVIYSIARAKSEAGQAGQAPEAAAV